MPLPSIQDLIATRNHKAMSAKDLVDKARADQRILTADEVVLFDKLTGEVKTLDGQIEQAEAHFKREEELAALVNRLEQPGGRKTNPDQPGASATVPATPHRVSKLKAFTGQGAEERAYRSGMWARAALLGDQRAAHWCESNGVGVGIRNALSTTGSANVLIPEEFSQAIIDLRESYGVFRRECNVVPMGRDTMLIPRRSGGVTVAFVGEGATISESTNPTWNNVRLTAKKLAGLVLMSAEVDEDAVVNLADWLAQEFAYALALKEDQCGFTGDGTSTYGGIRGLDNLFTPTVGLAGAVDAASGHDTFAEIDANDLASVMAKLPEYAHMGAKWYCSSVALDLVFGRLMAAAGGNTIQTIQGGYQRSYLGYPIVVSQVLATSTGDLSDLPMLYFGDLSKAATLGNRRGISVGLSDQRYFETDQIGVKVTERLDIVVHDVGTTSAAGPIVALVGE